MKLLLRLRVLIQQDTVTVRSLIRENLHDKETFMRCAKFNAPLVRDALELKEATVKFQK